MKKLQIHLAASFAANRHRRTFMPLTSPKKKPFSNEKDDERGTTLLPLPCRDTSPITPASRCLLTDGRRPTQRHVHRFPPFCLAPTDSSLQGFPRLLLLLIAFGNMMGLCRAASQNASVRSHFSENYFFSRPIFTFLLHREQRASAHRPDMARSRQRIHRPAPPFFSQTIGNSRAFPRLRIGDHDDPTA